MWGAAWLDPLMGMVGGIVILVWAWGLVKESSLILVDADSATHMRATITATLAEQSVTIRDLHVWRVGEAKYAAIVGIPANIPVSKETLRTALLKNPHLVHLTIDLV
jgi:Co/Zn/Cd efflux system component